MEESRFLYSVFPKKPIKGVLEDGRPINNRKSLNLTIDQVKQCMACGTVYRWFANDNKLERVTALNMERLHNATFMTEEEFEASKFDSVSKSTGSVVDTKVVEEPKVEEVAPAPVVEEKVEEVVVEPEPVVEETPVVEEAAPAVEEVVEEQPAVEEAPVAEEVVAEAEAPVEEVVEEKKENNNNGYYKKKKH
jgi:hypothetical protein